MSALPASASRPSFPFSSESLAKRRRGKSCSFAPSLAFPARRGEGVRARASDVRLRGVPSKPVARSQLRVALAPFAHLVLWMPRRHVCFYISSAARPPYSAASLADGVPDRAKARARHGTIGPARRVVSVTWTPPRVLREAMRGRGSRGDDDEGRQKMALLNRWEGRARERRRQRAGHPGVACVRGYVRFVGAQWYLRLILHICTSGVLCA